MEVNIGLTKEPGYERTEDLNHPLKSTVSVTFHPIVREIWLRCQIECFVNLMI